MRNRRKALLMKCKESELTPFGHAIAGSCAAFFSSIVVCPTEMIKNRMQAASELAKSGKFSFDQKITITSTTKQIMSEVIRGFQSFCMTKNSGLSSAVSRVGGDVGSRNARIFGFILRLRNMSVVDSETYKDEFELECGAFRRNRWWRLLVGHASYRCGQVAPASTFHRLKEFDQIQRLRE